MGSAQSVLKGKKPAYTFRKKGNEIQSAFIDQGWNNCVGNKSFWEGQGDRRTWVRAFEESQGRPG